MKPRNQNPLRIAARSSSLLGLCTLTFCILTAGRAASQTTWTGSTGSNWNDAANWSSGLPVNGTVLNFSGAPANGPTNNDLVGLVAGSINLTNNGTAGQTAAFTLGTLGQSIELGSGITTTAIAGGGTPITDIINLNLVIPINTFRLINTGLGHDVLINGVISGGTGTSLSKGGAGVLTLAGANTYTNFTYIDSGTLKLGAANVLPNVTVEIKRASGTDTNSILDLNGFSDTVGAINLGSLTTNSTNVGQTVSIVNSGGAATLTPGGAITYNAGTTGFLNGQATISANLVLTGTRNFIVGDGSAEADLRISGAISGASGNNLVKQGLGTLELSGNNTYSGALSIQDGRVRLGANDVLPNGSAVNVGTGGSTAGVTFDLNGFSDTVGNINLASSTSSTANLSHTLVNTGSAAVLKMNGVLNYNAGATNFNNGTATVSANLDLNAAARTFTIGDSINTVQETIISGNITNGSGTASLIKAGAGVLTLSGTNNYNGITSVTGGVLRLDATSALAAGNVTLSGGILGLGSDLAAGASDFERSLGTGAGQVQLTTTNSGFAAYGGDRTVNLGGSSAGVTFGDGGFLPDAVGINFNLGAASATHTLTFANPINLGTSFSLVSKFFNIGNGSAGVDAILSGAITQLASGGHTIFSKSGEGTLQLDSTSNAWTGNTFVDSGTLRLGSAGVIPNSSNVVVKRANGVNAAFSGILDLNGNSEAIGALTLGEATPDANNLNQTPTVIDSAGTTAVLTLGGDLGYVAGTSARNGQATVSANISTGNANRNFSVGDGASTNDLVISGVVSGSGTITKTATGTLLLSGANTYSGQLSISAGAVRLGADNVLPNAVGNIVQLGINTTTANVVLDINGFSDTVGPLRINGASSGNPAVAGLTHSIIDSAGAGVLTLSNTFNVYAGGANQYGQATISAGLNTGAPDRNFFVDNSSAAPIDLLVSGVISGVGNGFNMAGLGTVALSAENTFSGDTRTQVGIILLQNNLALKNSALNGAVSTTGTVSLDTGVTTPTLGGLKGTRDLSTVITGGYGLVSTLTLNPNSGSATYDGVIADGATGMILNKTGAGTQIFTNSQVYTGATNVNAGKLVVSGSIASSAAKVTGAGTILASDTAATIGSSLEVNNGAILAVGDAANAATATATVVGASTFNNGSIFSWDINASGTSYDKLVTSNVLGQASPVGDAVFRIVAADATFADAFWDIDRTWADIFTTDGSAAIADWADVFGGAVSVVNSSFASITPVDGSFSLTGSTLTWTAVPEPSSALVGLLVGAGLLRRRRA